MRELKWCGGRDSNPGRPTPADLERRRVPGVEAVDRYRVPEFIRRFVYWLSRDHVKTSVQCYKSYIRRPLNPDDRHSVLAYRVFIKFLHEEGIADLRYLLEYLKAKSAGIDLYVPSEEEVFKAWRTIERKDVKAVYAILISSGIRVREAVRMMCIYDKRRLVERDGIHLYPLKWIRGSKRIYYAFLCEPFIDYLFKKKMTWSMVTNHVARLNVLRPKYVRKFVATKMYELDIPAEIIDFIQGRVGRSILVRHYLNLLPRATEYYKKYVEWIKDNIL